MSPRPRLTDLQPGDPVETTRPCTDHSWGGRVVPAGTRGTLGRLYRIQDGVELWALWLAESIDGKSLLGVGHHQIRRVP